ncbi:MAG: hypothetical protein QXS74_07770 [Nitrososphaeria archaeon]
MKLSYSTIRLIEFLIVLIMFFSSIYSLLNNNIINLTILFFERSMQVSILYQLYPFIPKLLIIVLSSIFLYFYVIGQQKYLDRIYMISWIMHLPSIIYFSQIDWFQTLGLSISFQMLETKLSFTETLIIGIFLVAGRVMLFYTSKTREMYLELLGRGAEKNDLETILSRIIGLILLYVGSSAIATLAISYLIPTVKSLIIPITTFLPYPYIVIGVICLIMIPLCIIIYFYSEMRD